MRITSSQFPDTLAAQLQRLAQRQQQVQNQMATGQRIVSPSDDPLMAQQAMGLQDQSRAVQQFQQNAESHQEFATATFSVFRSLQTISDRAQELATAADGLNNPDELKIFAVELGQLIQQAVQVANTKHGDTYLLSGTRSDAPAFSAVTDANGNLTEVIFDGNDTVPESEIGPGQLVSSRVPGANSSGSGERGLLSDSRAGADFFGHLIALREQLLAGDTATIASTTRGQLRADEENLLYHIANNGALQSRLESAVSSRKDETLALRSDISRRADVDIAEASIEMQKSQLNYQAALQSAATMMNLTLLDFLR